MMCTILWLYSHSSIHSFILSLPLSLSISLTHGADIAIVGKQSLNGATAFLVDPQHTLDGVVVDVTTADCTGVFARFLEDIMAITGNQEPALLRVVTAPFSFHASRLRLELGDTLPLRWTLGHQHKEAPMVRQCGTHVRAPPAPEWRTVGQGQNPDAQQLPRQTPHCTDHWHWSHTTPGIGVHDLGDTHSPFLYPKTL